MKVELNTQEVEIVKVIKPASVTIEISPELAGVIYSLIARTAISGNDSVSDENYNLYVELDKLYCSNRIPYLKNKNNTNNEFTFNPQE